MDYKFTDYFLILYIDLYEKFPQLFSVHYNSLRPNGVTPSAEPLAQFADFFCNLQSEIKPYCKL